MMHPFVRITALAGAIAMPASALPSLLAAQGASRGAKVDPCSLLSLAEVKRVTGRTNYDPADRGDPGDGVGGGDRKQNTTARACTREPVPGLGLDAFVETCTRSPELPLYIRGGAYDVVGGVETKPIGGDAQAKPILIALAKTVAPRIR